METDGSISPEEALFQAASVLRSQFDIVAEGIEPTIKPIEMPKEKPAKKAVAKKAPAKKKTAKKK